MLLKFLEFLECFDLLYILKKSFEIAKGECKVVFLFFQFFTTLIRKASDVQSIRGAIPGEWTHLWDCFEAPLLDYFCLRG